MNTPSQRSAQILLRAREGHNFAEIAREFGCSREWVRRLAARNGITPRAKIRALHADLLVEVLAGASYKIIADQHGLSASWVSQIATKNGIRRKKKLDVLRVWDSESIKFLCAHKGIKTASELARSFGVSRNSILGVWHRYAEVAA